MTDVNVIAVDEYAAEVLLQAPDAPAAPLFEDDKFASELGLQSFTEGEVRYVVGGLKAPLSSRRWIVIPWGVEDGTFRHSQYGDPEGALRRILRAGLTQFFPARFLPQGWGPFHKARLVAFYASTIAQAHQRGERNRVVMYQGADSQAGFTLVAYSGSDPIALEAFASSESANDALASVVSGVRSARVPPVTLGRTGAEDFHLHPLASQVGGTRKYAEWFPLLTRAQRDFVTKPIERPVTVRGAAGTGKSLALVTKALFDSYEAASQERPRSTLILTHNWGSAETVRQTVASMHDREGDSCVTVATLASLASKFLELESKGITTISDDGHDGKLMQLELIESQVAEFIATDWLAYKSRCSKVFVANLTAKGASDTRRCAYALMNEYACVLSAERNMPKERYVNLPRTTWMMELPNPADREAVHMLYARFRDVMHSELRVFSMFDVINDLLRYLDSNSWDFLRQRDGFDTVLVDEFHLFNKQECLVFRYLLRSSTSSAIAAALDPRQGPTEAYVGYEAPDAVSGVLGSEVTRVSLDEVHRYTRQIDAVVRSLESVWSFDLGTDFEIPPRTAAAEGPVPELHSFATELQAFEYLRRLPKPSSGGTAILFLSMANFESFRKETVPNSSMLWITSRDSVAIAEHGLRKIIVSQPEYVAGLQFDSVIIADASYATLGKAGNRPAERRRLWSLLYLGITRAKRELAFVCTTDAGGELDLLGSAINDETISRST